MNRYTKPNPDYPDDYETMHFQLTPDEALTWAKLGIKHHPADAEPFVIWENDTISIGIRPKNPETRAVRDALDSMTTEELQQKCAMQKVKYRTDAPRVELVAALRQKATASPPPDKAK